MSNPVATIGDSVSAATTSTASSAKSGGGFLSGKRWIIALFIAAGLFMAYVLWQRSKTNAAATTAMTAAATDTSMVNQAGIENSQLAVLSQQVTSGQASTAAALSGIAVNANSAARDASGARTDASASNNTLNALARKFLPPPAPPAPPKPTPVPIGHYTPPPATHITPVPIGKYGHLTTL